MPTPTPILETERLLFRHHAIEDFEAYCEMESDPVYRGKQKVHPRAEIERSFHQGAMVPKPVGLLATLYKPDNRYVGRCGLYPYRADGSNEIVPGEAVLAYYLARPYWNRGLATEAGQAFVRYGFDVLKLNRIHAGMDAENLASVRVAEKSGLLYVRSGEGGGNRWHAYELTREAFQRD